MTTHTINYLQIVPKDGSAPLGCSLSCCADLTIELKISNQHYPKILTYLKFISSVHYFSSKPKYVFEYDGAKYSFPKKTFSIYYDVGMYNNDKYKFRDGYLLFFLHFDKNDGGLLHITVETTSPYFYYIYNDIVFGEKFPVEIRSDNTKYRWRYI